MHIQIIVKESNSLRGGGGKEKEKDKKKKIAQIRY
jgi:hypothetical protein